jgi:hypothetical protein
MLATCLMHASIVHPVSMLAVKLSETSPTRQGSKVHIGGRVICQNPFEELEKSKSHERCSALAIPQDQSIAYISRNLLMGKLNEKKREREEAK